MVLSEIETDGGVVRKAVLWLVGIAALVLVTTRTADIIVLADTVRSGSFLLLAVAVVFQVLRHAATALSYDAAFEAVGVPSKPHGFLPVVFGAMFMNTVMPSGGTAGPLLVIDDARRRGVETGRATSAMLLSQVAYFAGFATIMTVGFAIMASAGRLGDTERVAGAVLLAILALLGCLLLSGRRSPRSLRAVFGTAERVGEWGARVLSRPAPRPWAEGLVESFCSASAAIWSDPKAAGKVVAWATGGHLLDMGTFVAVGLAFGFDKVAPLVAGYVVAILLTLISFVPQGVGIVEAGVALLLTSYGAPGTIATAVSLVFRGIVFWLPVGIGAVLLQRTRSFALQAAEVKEGTLTFTARLAALLAAAFGLMAILGSMLPRIPRGLEDVAQWVPPAPSLSATSAVVAGIGLFMVARGLLRRRYLAWGISQVLLVTTSVLLLLSGAPWQSAAGPTVFALWLYTERSVFDLPSDRPTLRQGLLALGIAAAVTLAYGTLGFWALEHQFEFRYGLGAAFEQTVGMFVRFLDSGVVPTSGHGEWFVTSVYVVGISSAVVALAVAMAPMLISDFEEWKVRREERRGRRRV